MILIYGADVTNTDPGDRKQLLGILEIEPVEIRDVDKISEQGLRDKIRLGKSESWRFAVPVRRAWRIDTRIGVGDLLATTYDGTNGQKLAAYGQVITPEEARKVMALRVTEVSVFGEPLVPPSKTKVDFETAYSVSKGPVPSHGERISIHEDGEAFTYVMEFVGDVAKFLGVPGHQVNGKKLIKIGRTNDLARREHELNEGFPPSSLGKWKLRTNSQPYRTHDDAHDSERALHKLFAARATSQGGEFFLCEERLIDSLFAKEAKGFRLKA